MERQNCIREQELYANLKAHKGFIGNNEGRQHSELLLWKVIGCQEHEVSEPCGNKQARGIPHQGDCNNCPLESEVRQFITKLDSSF